MKTEKTFAQQLYTITAPGAVKVTATENGKVYPLASLGSQGGQMVFRAINSMVSIEGDAAESAIVHPFSIRAVALGRTNISIEDLVQEALANQNSSYNVGAFTYAGALDVEWRASLAGLQYGYKTFLEAAVIRFQPEGGLPNLSRAPYMFLGARSLSYFEAEMPNIVCMDYMFAGTTLRIFECSALPILNSAAGAFNGTLLPASEIVKILDMLPNHLSQEMWSLPIDPATGEIIPLDETSEEYAKYLAYAKSTKHYIDFEDCLGVPDVPAEAWAAAEAKGWTINRSSSTRFDSVLQFLKN